MGAGEEVANTRVASVGREPTTLRFVANWSDEEDRHEDGGEFEAIEDAIAWARARAPIVSVMLGFSEPVVFSAGERYEPGEEPGTDPLPTWPPPPELLERLLADQHVPRFNFGKTVVLVELEEDDDAK